MALASRLRTTLLEDNRLQLEAELGAETGWLGLASRSLMIGRKMVDSQSDKQKRGLAKAN